MTCIQQTEYPFKLHLLLQNTRTHNIFKQWQAFCNAEEQGQRERYLLYLRMYIEPCQES